MERVSRRLAKRVTVALAAVLLAGVAMPAEAASVDDPDNARGPLDLKRLVATKHDATAPLRVRLVTYGTWRTSLLDEDGESRLNFLFNSDHAGRVDFLGEVFSVMGDW